MSTAISSEAWNEDVDAAFWNSIFSSDTPETKAPRKAYVLEINWASELAGMRQGLEYNLVTYLTQLNDMLEESIQARLAAPLNGSHYAGIARDLTQRLPARVITLKTELQARDAFLALKAQKGL